MSQRLDLSDDNRVNWEGIGEGITAIEQIKALISIPDRLKQVLTIPGVVDRGRLNDAVCALEAGLASLGTLAKSPESKQIVRETNLGAKSYTDFCTAALLEAVQAVGVSLREATSVVGSLAAVLQDGHDLALGELPGCAQRLTTLRELRLRIRDIAQGVDALVASPDAPESRDWSSESETARCVLAFLDEYKDAPPPEMVQLVVCSATRDSVAKAVSELNEKRSGSFLRGWETLESVFDPAASVSTGVVINDLPLAGLAGWLRQRLDDCSRLQEWMYFRETEQRLCQLNLLPVLHKVIGGRFRLGMSSRVFSHGSTAFGWMLPTSRIPCCARSRWKNMSNS